MYKKSVSLGNSVPRGDLDSRPRAYELEAQWTMIFARVCGVTPFILQPLPIYGGVFE
jgi:hypothetical protein